MKLPKPKSEGSFEMTPAGNHVAICYMVVDLGTQESKYQDEVKRARKVMLGFELPNEKMEDGRPFAVSRRYPFSTHEKSTFRKHLESWRGKKFADTDFGPDGFDIKNLIGKTCMVNVIHTTSGDRTYANVDSISPVPKGTVLPVMENDPTYLSLEPAEFKQEDLNNLPEWIQTIVYASPEYLQLATRGKVTEAPKDDDIPF